MITQEIAEKWNKFVIDWQYRDCGGTEKYLHFRTQYEKFDELVKATIKEGKRLRTVDISAGMGFLPYVLKCYSHNVQLTDCICARTEIYRQAHEALGLPPMIDHRYANNRFAPLPECIDKVDLITAIASAPMSYWTAEDWAGFFKDCAAHLNPDGMIILSPNINENIAILESIIGTENKHKTSQLTYYIVR